MMARTSDPGATQRSLTNTAIDALAKGGRLKDDRVPGLEVRRHQGGASFLLYYRTKNGTVRRPKIGSYPLLTISQAREIARNMLAQVAAGRDPVGERLVARDAPTVDDLWTKCEETVYGRGKVWDGEAKRLYTKRAKAKLGKMKCEAVRYADVKEVHEALRSIPVEANRTVAVLSRIFAEAERLGWRPEHSNPCANVQRYPAVSRRRYASPEEIGRLGAALDKYAADPEHVSGVAFLALMMFSGARPSELLNGTPDMVERREDGAGVLRVAGKTGPRAVFLPPPAMQVLGRLPDARRSLCGRTSVPRGLWSTLVTECALEGLWMRDLRRTFATVALSSGVPIGQVGELLGHASTQTTKIYAKLLEDSAHAAAASVAERMGRMLSNGHSRAGDTPRGDPA